MEWVKTDNYEGVDSLIGFIMLVTKESKMNFDDEIVEIPCNKCKRKNKKTINWLKQNNKLICKCGTEIVIESSQFKKEISKIEQSLEELDRILKNFGKLNRP